MSTRIRSFFVAIALFTIATNYTFSAETARPYRYELNGTAVLTADAPAQRGGTLRLRAALSPPSPQTEMPSIQSAGRFALSATLAARTLVCHSDTIFRDDLEGDGF